MSRLSAGSRAPTTNPLDSQRIDRLCRPLSHAPQRTSARYTAASARPWGRWLPRDTDTHCWGDHVSPDHGAWHPRAAEKPRRRRALLAATVGLVSLLAAAAASPARPAGRAGPWVWHAQPRTKPVAGAAVIRRTTWLPRFRITEYYPAPEAWAVGVPVSAPGLRAKHRIDWLYSGLGLSMEGTGIGLDGRPY